MTHRKWLPAVLIIAALGIIGSTFLLISSSSPFAAIPTLVPTFAPPSPSSTPPTPTALPTETPTPLPPKVLNICQIEEPNTLFIYGNPSRASRVVMEAIYDGPIDTPGYQFQPTILAQIPTLSNKGVAQRVVRVQEGDQVIGTDNDWTGTLAPGVRVYNAAGEAVTFEGDVVTMTQTVVTFTLRTDVTWADGHPLTAADSIYAFQLVKGLDTALPPHAQLLRDRTLAYEAIDEHTIVWRSVPGYQDTFYFYSFPLQNSYVQNFYSPLPQHVMQLTDGERLLDSEQIHRQPLGWGPFVIERWEAGQSITLVRNPHYYRSGEGLPYLDRVTFRFVAGLQQALAMVETGQCDVITQDVIESGQDNQLQEAIDAGKMHLIQSSSGEWEHLGFGIESTNTSHPDFFTDVRVRQAIAHCIDRQRIVENASPYGQGAVAHSYIASEHPLYAEGDLLTWAYRPADGKALLAEVGWEDEDGDGMREAHGVTGVAWNTPFSITLLTTNYDAARQQTANIIAQDLAACGINLTVKLLPAKDFIADGPDGPVLGRQFDLALYSWHNSLYAPCELFLSSQIPGPENWWASPNTSGYASPDYDAACHTALAALSSSQAHARAHREAQVIFSHDLPVLPLYFVPKTIAARPGVSGLMPDPSEYLTWHIETVDIVP